MFKKLLIPAGIALAGVLTISVLVVAKPKPEPRPPEEEPAIIQVAVAEARQESLRLRVEAQGTVRPKREIDLVAQVSGQIVSVDSNFVAGGFFEPAQVLVQIDDREYRAAVMRAKAEVAEAEQRLAEERGRSRQARREWRDLGDANANDLFLRKPQLAAAEAGIESARAALATAELNLERTRIAVPFPGRIRSKQVDLGQYVSVGTPLAKVYDSSVVEVRLPLTEAQAALVDLPLAPGGGFTVEQPPLVKLRASVAGRPQEWQGLLTRTDAFVDENSRMYYAVVEVNEPFAAVGPDGAPQAPLLPGLFVEAEIEGKQLDRVVQLPRSALFERDKLLTLDSENRVTEQRVRVLRRSDDAVWVQASLADMAMVSLEKQSLTPVGTQVEPLLPKKAEADPLALTADNVAGQAED